MRQTIGNIMIATGEGRLDVSRTSRPRVARASCPRTTTANRGRDVRGTRGQDARDTITSRNGGYSLIELMIAIGIMGVGMTMAAALFPTAIKQNQSTFADMQGMMLCENGLAIAKTNFVHNLGTLTTTNQDVRGISTTTLEDLTPRLQMTVGTTNYPVDNVFADHFDGTVAGTSVPGGYRVLAGWYAPMTYNSPTGRNGDPLLTSRSRTVILGRRLNSPANDYQLVSIGCIASRPDATILAVPIVGRLVNDASTGFTNFEITNASCPNVRVGMPFSENLLFRDTPVVILNPATNEIFHCKAVAVARGTITSILSLNQDLSQWLTLPMSVGAYEAYVVAEQGATGDVLSPGVAAMSARTALR